MLRLAIATLFLCSGISSAAQMPGTAPTGAPRWIKGAAVRLMVLSEVNSRQAKVGERVKLRVDAPVLVDNVVAIPIGASAWGEVIATHGTSAAGGRGHLSARLLFVDTPSGRVELSGTQARRAKATRRASYLAS